MISNPASTRLSLAALGALILGGSGCALGAAFDIAGFHRAWLCAFLFWLGVPLAGLTLVMVHDLCGGQWMATARPRLNAAVATMPLATLAAIPAFIGLRDLYSWTHPAPDLGNAFYLNTGAFLMRYAAYLGLWNLLAGYALWAPRDGSEPIASGLSWLSGIGLVLLAFSVSFAAIDWIMSLEPRFWSSVFMMIAGASWFNTGLALVLLVVAMTGPAPGSSRDHMADLCAILFATTIFWAYVEFVQFLIVWEENLGDEIPWYLIRIDSRWAPAILVSVTLGFLVPFFALITRRGKRSRVVVTAVCLLILLSRIADKWWLILPEFPQRGPFWLDISAVVALGGLILLCFFWWLRRFGMVVSSAQSWEPGHG